MQDVDLIDLIATNMEEGLENIGLGSVLVIQKNQSTQQGLEIGNQLFLEVLYSHVYGWPLKGSVYDKADFFYEKEDQIYITNFQISGLFPDIPNDNSIRTANDVISYLQRYMTSMKIIRAFKKRQVSLLKVSSVRIPKFSDDMSQFESIPSFDLSIIHRNAIINTISAIEKVRGKLYEV